jgi:hypothetical protein
VGGYNWVKNSGLFYGAEADVNYMSNDESVTHCQSCLGNTVATQRTKWTGYGTMRGKPKNAEANRSNSVAV